MKHVISTSMVVAILGSGFAGASLAEAQQLFAFPKKRAKPGPTKQG